MARKKREVNQKDFEEVLAILESQQEFPNLSALWNAVAATPWALGNGVTPSVAYLRARDFNLISRLKTQAGRKGRAPGSGPVAPGPRKPRRKVSHDLSIFRARTPASFHRLITIAEKGSKSAALKLHCLQCCAFVRKEVRNCSCYSCPLHPFRPYQDRDTEAADFEESEERDANQLESELEISHFDDSERSDDD
jgi:hypothetical protein